MLILVSMFVFASFSRSPVISFLSQDLIKPRLPVTLAVVTLGFHRLFLLFCILVATCVGLSLLLIGLSLPQVGEGRSMSTTAGVYPCYVYACLLRDSKVRGCGHFPESCHTLVFMFVSLIYPLILIY